MNAAGTASRVHLPMSNTMMRSMRRMSPGVLSLAHLVSSYVGTIPFDIGLFSQLQHFEKRDTKDFGYTRRRYLQGTSSDSIGLWTALKIFM
jgi:hypothetical protein